MKIIAFAGSNSSKSINKKLANYVLNKFEGNELELLDINDYEAPLFGVDIESKIGIPAVIHDFASKISNSDFIILSLAEHNGAYSTAFKNLFDWLSRIPNRKIFDNKPLLLMATSPGGRGGASVLAIASDRFPRDGAQIKGVFSLPSFNDNFQDGIIVNNDKLAELMGLIDQVKAELLK